jgi:hypothetical protein
MNLYLISQDENNGWDTYDSAVVSAETVEDAQKIDPSGCRIWSDEHRCWLFVFAEHTVLEPSKDSHSSWVNDINTVSVEFLGEYIGNESKVILASFNAG